MSPQQFNKNIEQHQGKELTNTQKLVASLAYGIFIKELSRETGKLHKENSELKIELARKDVDIEKERSRTTAVGLLGGQSIKALTSLLINPLNTGIPQHIYPGLDKASVIDVEPVDATSKENRASANQFDEETIKNVPWIFRTPIAIFARTLAGMSPLALVFIFVAMFTLSASVATFSGSIWKSNYEAEQQTTKQLLSQLEAKDDELRKLNTIKFDHARLTNEHSALTREHEILSGNLKTQQDEFVALQRAHVEDLQKQAAAYTDKILQFESDSEQGFKDTLIEYAAKISHLENQTASLSINLEESNTALAEERRIIEARREREKALQQDNTAQLDEIDNLANRNISLANENTELKTLLVDLRQILHAVDTYFWHKYGNLEVRRACFRQLYQQTISARRQLAESQGILTDMPSSSYDLIRDPSGRLKECDNYLTR